MTDRERIEGLADCLVHVADTMMATHFGRYFARYVELVREAAAELRRLSAAEAGPFQARVQPWMMTCFGVEISGDRTERNHRFVEEALELAQACGCTDSEAHQLVYYVWGRPVGHPHQEVGGVMVTLAALCLAYGMDMHQAGEDELARVWTKIDVIRAKQAAKPKHSPLPEMPPPVTPAQMPGATATEQPGGALGETEDVKEIRLLRLALIDANVVFGITNDTQWHQVYADVLDRALRANPMPPLVAPDLPEATEQAGGGADAADGLRRMAEEHEVGDALAGVDLEPDATRPDFAAQAKAVERAVQVFRDWNAAHVAALAAAAETLKALPGVVEAASAMPRTTPAGGGASTVHTYQIEASTVWALDRALRRLGGEA